MRKSVQAKVGLSNAGTPKFRSENLFRLIAKHQFPRKTAEHVGGLVGAPTSTVYDWLAGRSDAPFHAYIAVIAAELLD